MKPLTLDITNGAQIEHAVCEVGSLDVLVNNAGIALYDDLSKDDTIGQQLEVNFFGPLHLIRAVLPALKKSRGAILNNLSMAAIAPMPVVSGVFHLQGRSFQHDAVASGLAFQRRCYGSLCRPGSC